MKKLPRGLRNCNPGNIRTTRDRWQGLRPVQTDPEFFQFETMAWGYRALMRTLQNYRLRHGCRTVADFIGRWAPPTENDTAAYIRTVCNDTGFTPDKEPDITDQWQMVQLAAAISHVENGEPADFAEVHKGWELLMKSER